MIADFWRAKRIKMAGSDCPLDKSRSRAERAKSDYAFDGTGSLVLM